MQLRAVGRDRFFVGYWTILPAGGKQGIHRGVVGTVRHRRLVGLLAALGLVVAACGAETTGDDPETAAPTTTTPEGTTTTAEPGTSDVGELTFSVADGWSAQALGQGVKPVITLDPDGAPGVAWLLERKGSDGFVAYASAAGGWEVEIAARGYFYGPIDLDYSPEGQPNIVIHDHQADTFNPSLGNLVRLFREGGEWVEDVAENPGHDGWDSTIAIAEDGVIHAAAVDPAQFGRTDGVEYYRNDGDGWEVTQIGSGPVSYQYNVGLALDPSGSPAISYYNDAEQHLVFAGLVGGSWELEVVAEEGTVGKYSSLAFTPDGRPAISFFNQFSSQEGEILYAAKDGDLWVVESVGEIDVFSERNARRNSSLAFDSQGRAHVVFSDTSAVWYSVRGDDGWETTQIVTGSLPLGQLVSLAIDGDDRPHLTLYEVTDEGRLDGVVAYLTTG